MSNLRNYHDYQIYLNALSVYKEKGYDVTKYRDKKKEIEYTISRGAEHYGRVFIVSPPGFLARISNEWYSMSTYANQRDYCKKIAASYYWPDDSLVGVYTMSKKGWTMNKDILTILKMILSK